MSLRLSPWKSCYQNERDATTLKQKDALSDGVEDAIRNL
jgi:hypothetical protein